MPQERHPYLTTSVSGIGDDEWESFGAKAQQQGISKREAFENAVNRLSEEIKIGRKIDWIPPKMTKRRPIKIHADALDKARAISESSNLRLNVIFITAMYLWVKDI